MQLEYLVISLSPAISTQMFSHHQKNVHSYVKADDPNRFFFSLQITFAPESCIYPLRNFQSTAKTAEVLSARQLVNISRNACNSAGISRPTAIHVRSIIIIIVVVVVVDDDTYYWVYLSSDHLFQVYYKVRQLFYYKVRRLLKSATLQCIFQTGNFVSAFTTNYAFFRQSIMQFVNLI